MPIPEPHARLLSAGLAVFLGALTAAWGPSEAIAQAKPATDKAAGVFDDQAQTPSAKDGEKADGKAVRDREVIGFTQENAAVQMAELEERMFRLSEALRSLEPENASRLRLALKFSREELILEQMRETQALLKEAQLGKAETEVRELLAKLEHLRDLLLAENLDFQLKLARLRQMRETIGQLERIVKEEKRELGWSRFAIEQRKEIERLAARKPDLETLVRDQEQVLASTKTSNDEAEGAARSAVLADLRTREVAIRNATAALAADPVFADLQPPHLRRADGHLGDALAHLAAPDVQEAIATEEKALGLLREELDRLSQRSSQAEKAIAQAEFQRHESGQAKNRAATDMMATVSARLGETGVALQKDLIRASSSMESAEGRLAKSEASPAADEQSAALEALTRSGDTLAQALERLLVELRTELHARLIGELTEMHEIQASIRETTEAQAPRVAQKSRTALIALANLSRQETEIAERIEQLLALVEETEYGIALPTALRVLGREMRTIEGWLKEGDASPRTIALEKRVEEDLLGLLQAIHRLPPSTPPAPGMPLPSDLRARERELNRLVAELKMIRLLQSRLNDDTVEVDKSRPNPAALTAELRRQVEELEASQDEIRESLVRIAERIEEDAAQPE